MRFGDFLEIEKNSLIQIDSNTHYVIAGVQNYGKGILNKRNLKGIELTMKKYQLIREDQLMWCKVDTKNGAFGVTKKEHVGSLASTNMCLANINVKKALPEFLQLLFTMDWFYNSITEKSTGTTNRQYLTPQQILEIIEIPDFTLDEQREFIRKHDVVTGRGLSNELSLQENYIQQLRHAILQEAVQGKLTKQNKDDEPADKLLQRIKVEKQKLIAAGKLKKEKELPPITEDELPFQLPKGWVWCRFGETCINKDGERIPLSELERKTRQGVYDYYGAQGVIDKIDDYLFNKSLLLIAEDGGNLLRRSKPVAYIAHGKFWVNNHAHVVDAVNYITMQYLEIYINSIDLRPYLNGEPPMQIKLNQGKLLTIPVSLPPFSEQQRIVAKVEQLMQMVSGLEKQVEQSQAQTEQLLKAVLKAAFRNGGKKYDKNEMITMAAER